MYDMTIGHDIKKDHHHIFYFPIIKYYSYRVEFEGLFTPTKYTTKNNTQPVKILE